MLTDPLENMFRAFYLFSLRIPPEEYLTYQRSVPRDVSERTNLAFFLQFYLFSLRIPPEEYLTYQKSVPRDVTYRNGLSLPPGGGSQNIPKNTPRMFLLLLLLLLLFLFFFGGFLLWKHPFVVGFLNSSNAPHINF